DIGLDAVASMGPPSFESGKSNIAAPKSQTLRFNGAALIRERKASTCATRRSAWCGFNGAALFRERKVRPRPRAVAEASPGFNGAALFRERKAAYFPDSAREAIRVNGAALFRERKGLERRERILVVAGDALRGPACAERRQPHAA